MSVKSTVTVNRQDVLNWIKDVLESVDNSALSALVEDLNDYLYHSPGKEYLSMGLHNVFVTNHYDTDLYSKVKG